MSISISIPSFRRHRQAGFTILELMIATMVFSVILLVVAAGILSFTKQYIKGISASTTQAVARAVMSDVVQNIQFSGGNIKTSTTLSPNQLCVGNVVYYYSQGQQATTGQHALVKDTGSCASTGITNFQNLAPGQTEMLGQGMRLAEFSVDAAGSGGAKVTVTVVSGAYDLLTDKNNAKLNSEATAPTDPFDWSSVRCKSGAGSQFCGVSHLTTYVNPRIGN